MNYGSESSGIRGIERFDRVCSATLDLGNWFGVQKMYEKLGCVARYEVVQFIAY
jgi:hypothetical protein